MTDGRSDAAPVKREPRRNLVPGIAERLREEVFAAAPGDRIGSLPDLAARFGVGIVTVQQAARILEHEGLLEVRRGPGGGYYGRRPDPETIERALQAYLRMHPGSYAEALDITSLLFIELCGAAAQRVTEDARARLRHLSGRFARCAAPGGFGELEVDLQELLFEMVDRPIFEMLTRMTLSFARGVGVSPAHGDASRDDGWIAGRLRIIAAIDAGDIALARFEAHRSNRQIVISA